MKKIISILAALVLLAVPIGAVAGPSDPVTFSRTSFTNASLPNNNATVTVSLSDPRGIQKLKLTCGVFFSAFASGIYETVSVSSETGIENSVTTKNRSVVIKKIGTGGRTGAKYDIYATTSVSFTFDLGFRAGSFTSAGSCDPEWSVTDSKKVTRSWPVGSTLSFLQPTPTQTNTQTPNPTITYSVAQKTLATFSSTATGLTSQQKAQVKAAVEANPTAEKFICTGIRYYSQPMSINIMVRKRAKAACEYAKQLNPELSTWYQNKPTQAKSYAGKVLLTVKSLEAPTVELTEIGLTAPTLSTSLGTVTVRWDGKYTNLNGRPAPSSSIFQTVEIFMSTSNNPLSSQSNKVADLSAGLEVLTGPTVQPCKTYYFALKSVIGGNTYASEPRSIQVDTVFGCGSSSGGSDLGYYQLNQEVKAASGMTVKVTQLSLEPRSGSTRLNLTYVMNNGTSASEITEGSFKLFFSDGSSLNQNGFFNALFPGGRSTRSYVFEWTGSKTPQLIEYDAGFFQNDPGNGLKWQVTEADPAEAASTATPTPSATPSLIYLSFLRNSDSGDITTTTDWIVEPNVISYEWFECLYGHREPNFVNAGIVPGDCTLIRATEAMYDSSSNDMSGSTLPSSAFNAQRYIMVRVIGRNEVGQKAYITHALPGLGW